MEADREKLSAADARIAFDLGVHASNQAMEIVGRVMKTAPTDIAGAIACVAIARLRWQLNNLVDAYTTNADPEFKRAVEDAQKIMEKDSPKFADWAAAKAKEYGLG